MMVAVAITILAAIGGLCVAGLVLVCARRLWWHKIIADRLDLTRDQRKALVKLVLKLTSLSGRALSFQQRYLLAACIVMVPRQATKVYAQDLNGDDLVEYVSCLEGVWQHMVNSRDMDFMFGPLCMPDRLFDALWMMDLPLRAFTNGSGTAPAGPLSASPEPSTLS